MIIALLIAAAAAAPAAAGPAPATPTPTVGQPLVLSGLAPSAAPCTSNDADEVLVCAQRNQRYRIDPLVLEASRARNAEPPKPPATAEASPTMGCIGPSACKGDQIPLVRMGLVALKAAALALDGQDWRNALRTREDEYRLYEAAKARSAKARRPRVTLDLRK
jgi:hypothetical protein